MATRNVADERMESKRELEAAREELDAVMEKYAAAELAATDGSESAGALLDGRIRRTALSAARRGLEAAYAGDRVGRRGGERAGVRGVRGADAVPGPRGRAGGDGAGPGDGADGAARVRRLRDERAAARGGAGHRRLDDAGGAAAWRAWRVRRAATRRRTGCWWSSRR